MNSQAPYGYIKSPQDKHILIIDDEAAKIVRRLFNEYVSGDSARMIANRLNTEKWIARVFTITRKLGAKTRIYNTRIFGGARR